MRGGGHHIAGLSISNGGLMINLSRMNAMEVDPGAQTARVQGGATFADLDHETQAFGLAVPGGVVSSTGVGGFGRLSRLHGLTADNLLSAQVITAEGTLVAASPDANPDLFWGIRGGGGNFGIVTSFEFRLHPVGPEVLFGPLVYRLEDAAAVLKNYRRFTRNAPRECCVWAEFIVTPGGGWADPAQDDAMIAWVRECHEALAPHAIGGSYVNFVTEEQGRERDACGANYERLVELKNKYDPMNLFWRNQNIRSGA